jgi:hypothetical protein
MSGSSNPWKVAAVRSESDECRAAAVVAEPLDELAELLRFGIGQGRVWDLGVDDTFELVDRAEPLATGLAHADDAVGILVDDLGHRVEHVVVHTPHDADLAADGRSDLEQLAWVHRAVLAVGAQVLLGGQRLSNRCVVGDHDQTPPTSIAQTTLCLRRAHLRQARRANPC